MWDRKGSSHVCLANKDCKLTWGCSWIRFPLFLLSSSPVGTMNSFWFFFFLKSRSKGSPTLKNHTNRNKSQSFLNSFLSLKLISLSWIPLTLEGFSQSCGADPITSHECDLGRVYERRTGLFLAPRNRPFFTGCLPAFTQVPRNPACCPHPASSACLCRPRKNSQTSSRRWWRTSKLMWFFSSPELQNLNICSAHFIL